jgi:hypothetical protein
VGVVVGVADGAPEGARVFDVGTCVGLYVVDAEGYVLGTPLGAIVVGAPVIGVLVGAALGAAVGPAVSVVGAAVGTIVGVGVGAAVGEAVGADVGAEVGAQPTSNCEHSFLNAKGFADFVQLVLSWTTGALGIGFHALPLINDGSAAFPTIWSTTSSCFLILAPIDHPRWFGSYHR